VTFHLQLFKTSRYEHYNKVLNCDISPTGTKTKATQSDKSQFQTKDTDLLNLAKPSSNLHRFPLTWLVISPLTNLIPLQTSLSPSSIKSSIKSLTLPPSL